MIGRVWQVTWLSKFQRKIEDKGENWWKIKYQMKWKLRENGNDIIIWVDSVKHNIFVINSSLILWKTATFVNLIYAKWKYTHMNNKIIFLLFNFLFLHLVNFSSKIFKLFVFVWSTWQSWMYKILPFLGCKQEMKTN